MEAGIFLSLNLLENQAALFKKAHTVAVKQVAPTQRIAFTWLSISSGDIKNVTRLTD